MEFISEKAISIWGPFAFIVIILILAVIVLARYFYARQKYWDEMDERRNTAFILVTKEFNDTAKEFSNNATRMNDVLVELKGLMNAININVIKMGTRK